MVFVQYLFGLAVIEWIEEFFHGRVLARLKWPNDIYASPTGVKSPDAFRKMGGILVNCSFGGPDGTECKLIVGGSHVLLSATVFALWIERDHSLIHRR